MDFLVDVLFRFFIMAVKLNILVDWWYFPLSIYVKRVCSDGKEFHARPVTFPFRTHASSIPIFALAQDTGKLNCYNTSLITIMQFVR